MKRKTIAALLAASLATGLTACSPSADDHEATAKASAQAAQQQADSLKYDPSKNESDADGYKNAPGAESSNESDDDGAQMVGLGHAAAYEDGLGMTVAYVKHSHVTGYADGADDTAGNIIVFKVTIENDSRSTFDASLAMIDSVTLSDGSNAESVYDDHYDGVDFTNIPAGQKQSFDVAFAAEPDVHSVTIQASPGMEYEPTLWQGQTV